MDRIAEVAQLLDVSAHGPHVDLKALCQVGSDPITGSLQQREQTQQSGGGFQHVPQSLSDLGPDLS
ncbi:hypothetical protein GCM10027280_49880 [Micromonospora polyrhachis]